jgi:hypothetical protein
MEIVTIRLVPYMNKEFNFEITLSYILSPYRAVNALRLNYKNQPVNGVQ